jgi:hypothetical protein
VSLEIRTPSGTLPVTAFCEGAMPLSRTRTFAARQGRAGESDVWQVFGDRMENPSEIKWQVTLKRDLTRDEQRDAMDTIRAFARAATSIYVIPDQRETAVTWGEVTQESPTEKAYTLELTFYPAGASSVPAVSPDTGVY